MKITENKKARLPNKFEALLPILVLLTLMILNYILQWGQDPHIPVLLAAITAMFVGCLVGSFEWAGIIPSLVYYGLKLLSPAIFLSAVTVLCTIVGLSLDSSYTVSATLGIAFTIVSIGGIYFQIGAVESLLGGMIKKVKTPFQLILVTILTAMFCITTMCDQYLGLIIPASMYKEKYDDMGLGRNLLSRSMEDGGTLWSPLVAIATASWKGNILYADGSYTNFFGKLKKGKPAQAPEKAHQHALEALEKIRKTLELE